MGHITILGSLNYDCIAQLRELPRPGRTVRAQSLAFRLGGGGGTQGVAAARHGSTVSIIAALGEDSAGLEYLGALEANGIEVEGISRHAGVATGMTFISEDARLESLVVTGGGANDCLKPETLDECRSFIARANILLTHLDIPLETALAGLKLAPMMGTATCLKPSPWRDDFPWGTCQLDFVIVNAQEARDLLGRHVLHLGDAVFVLERLQQLNIQTLIVTRGADSTLIFSQQIGSSEVPTLVVKPLDVSGAGDCFAGTFAARWAEEKDTRNAVRAAGIAASLCIQRSGLQESMPRREDVDALLATFAK